MERKRGKSAKMARMEADLTEIADQVAAEMGDWFDDGPAPPAEVVSIEAFRAAKGSIQDDGSGGGDLRV